MGDCQIMSICLACFGRSKHDESENSKDVIKIKWSMINSFDDKLDALEEQFITWRKYSIDDSLRRNFYMNGIVVGFCEFC